MRLGRRRRAERRLMTVAAVVTSVVAWQGPVVPTAAASLHHQRPVRRPSSPRSRRASLTASPSITVTLDDIPDAGRDIGFTTCLHGSGCSSFSLDDDADPTLTNKASAEGAAGHVHPHPGHGTLELDARHRLQRTGRRRQRPASGHLRDPGQRGDLVHVLPNRLPGLSVRHVTQPTLTDVGQPDQPFTYHGCLGGGCCRSPSTTAARVRTERQSSAVARHLHRHPGRRSGWTVTAIACPGAVGSTPPRQPHGDRGRRRRHHGELRVHRARVDADHLLDATPRTTQSFSFTGCRQGGGCADFLGRDHLRRLGHTAPWRSPRHLHGHPGATAGWDLTSLSCLGGGSTDVPNRRATRGRRHHAGPLHVHQPFRGHHRRAEHGGRRRSGLLVLRLAAVGAARSASTTTATPPCRTS